MKNLMSYILADGKGGFDIESERMVKIQIDNSLEIGWTRQQIILATDFPYSYNGVQSVVVENAETRAGRKIRDINKVGTILWLYDQGLLDEDIFFHDLDAFQNHDFLDFPDEQYRPFPLSVAPYGDEVPRYNTGCMFFKPSARPIWKRIYEQISPIKRRYSGEEAEAALLDLYPPGQQTHVAMLDISYNIFRRNVIQNWLNCIQPPRIVHFHPMWYRGAYYRLFVLGQNELKKSLVSERLQRLMILHIHGECMRGKGVFTNRKRR